MKKILLLTIISIMAFLPATAFAQTPARAEIPLIGQGDELYIRKSFLRRDIYTGEGIFLMKYEAKDLMRDNAEALKHMRAYQTCNVFGNILFYGGMITTAAAIGVYADNRGDGRKMDWGILSAGIGGMVFSGVLWTVKSGQLRKAVDAYNSSLPPAASPAAIELSMGITSTGGYGLTLKF